MKTNYALFSFLISIVFVASAFAGKPELASADAGKDTGTDAGATANLIPFQSPAIPGRKGHGVIDQDLLKRHEELFELVPTGMSEKDFSQQTYPQKLARVSKLVAEKNRSFVADLKQSAQDVTKSYLDKKSIDEIYEELIKHPVVSESAAAKYDNSYREIGYCFGRAAFVHWELLRRKVDANSIGKIFVIGKLTYPSAFFQWKFHVATTVLDNKRNWIVIDALMKEPLTLEQWMKEVSKFSATPKLPELEFVFSDPNKFQPVPGAYSTEALSQSYYRGFFVKLHRWFRDKGADPAQMLAN